MLKLSYDNDGDVMEIRFSKNSIEDSEYIEDSGIVVDYDKYKKIVAIEIISFSKRVYKEEVKEALVI